MRLGRLSAVLLLGLLATGCGDDLDEATLDALKGSATTREQEERLVNALRPLAGSGEPGDPLPPPAREIRAKLGCPETSSEDAR